MTDQYASYRTRTSGLAWRETAGEIVVLDLHSSFYFGLNPTGARLWRSLVDGASRDQLLDQLMAAGAGDPARAADDVDEFLDVLHHEGLVEAPTPRR